MADYFFDTSALVKRHVRESGSDWVRERTGPRSPDAVYLSRITAVEVVAAITRRQRGGSLSTAQGGAILGHFRRHLANRYRILELTPSLLEDAMTRARAHGLRAYDAVQLATALGLDRLNRKAGRGRITLVSADGELNAAALGEGLPVENPDDHR